VKALTPSDIRQALGLLNEQLASREVTGELCLFGGAVMALVFDARVSTRDVDATMKPRWELEAAAEHVAQTMALPSDWLNDGVKGFLSEDGSYTAEDMPQFSHLRVMRPTADYLLAMKCLAARSAYESTADRSDLKVLIRHLQISEAKEALDLVLKFYPAKLLPAKTRYFVEEVFQEIQEEDQAP
jgi:hypothetical protein